MAERRTRVRWVRRNWPVGVVPFIIREDDLPRNQKILVFLPHSDDGRYIGASLSVLNRDEGAGPRNDMRIVVVCPGYRSVEGALSDEEKSRLRWEEALCWGRTLGFQERQLVSFRADKTYASRRCAVGDQERMDALVRAERPSMVFITHHSDIAQHANYCTRSMALTSLVRWMAGGAASADGAGAVFVVEYPTLYVPILPPSDKNVIIAFSDPSFPKIKHDANACHKSQEPKYFEAMGRFVEAIDAMSGADVVIEARRAGERFAKCLSEVTLNPVKSRAEHFGVTRLGPRGGGREPLIVEKRLLFPLSPEEASRWSGLR